MFTFYNIICLHKHIILFSNVSDPVSDTIYVPSTGQKKNSRDKHTRLVIYFQGFLAAWPHPKKEKWNEENMKKAVNGVLRGKFSIRKAAGHFCP